LDVGADLATIAVVQNRNGIAGKDHREGQGYRQPETAILFVWMIADFDIFAHCIYFLCCLPILLACKILCRDRANLHFWRISAIFQNLHVQGASNYCHSMVKYANI
jgi:hypothetical protein